jgi:ArsR family transcriptional regulator, arsenate/arsenite/antimonite-responsive transcriptional repressor
MNEVKTITTLTKNEQKSINIMSALGDRTRYKIFKLLLNNDGLCVGEIAESLDISISAVSQHFRTFELIGLVDKERFGQKICYSLRIQDHFIKNLISSLI